MACVARLSFVEIDIFLTSASPDQRAIVRTLREIITRRAGGLAERVSTGKQLTGYLLYEGPGDQVPQPVPAVLVTLAVPARGAGRPLGPPGVAVRRPPRSKIMSGGVGTGSHSAPPYIPW